MTVETSDLAAVPDEHRELIARWLNERAAQFRPTFLLTDLAAGAVRDVLRGAAVDLARPAAEDSTTGHANEVLADLSEVSEGEKMLREKFAALAAGERWNGESCDNASHNISNVLDGTYDPRPDAAVWSDMYDENGRPR